MNRPTQFQPLPQGESLRLAWPTPNRRLRDPAGYFAATRANPEYGKPGWTRECGRRFHRGCDIAPVDVTQTGGWTTLMFTDLATGREYPSREPTRVPHDPVCCVLDGVVEEACYCEGASGFGKHTVVRHQWPDAGDSFFTLYGHLATLAVREGERVVGGAQIGVMGATSQSPEARNWMAVAPHLHFEVWDTHRQPYDPAEFLRRYLP